MQKKLYLLLILLPFTHATNTADNDSTEIAPLISANKEVSADQIAQILVLIKKDNATIASYRGVEKYMGYAERFCNNPYNFLTLFCAPEQERENALVKHIMNQNFTINDEGVFAALGPSLALQMMEKFEQDQKKEAKKYLNQSTQTRYQKNEDIACAMCAWFGGFGLDMLTGACVPEPASFIVGPALWCTCIACASCKICCPNV